MTKIKNRRKRKKNNRNVLPVGFTVILIGTIILFGKMLFGDSLSLFANDNSIKDLYYYEADKEERYNSFIAEHPEYLPDDSVWMVNSNLDSLFYYNPKEIIHTENLPLLVNKYNVLPYDYAPPNLVKLPSGRQVTAETKAAYIKMTKESKALGYKIKDVSAYRSINQQRSTYNNYLNKDLLKNVDTYSARPGFSEHQTGRAIDICGSNGVMNKFAQTKESLWIEENAYRYGFIVRYPKNQSYITGYIYEPWHITYVGKDEAEIMKTRGIETLEEYMVRYVDHNPE